MQYELNEMMCFFLMNATVQQMAMIIEYHLLLYTGQHRKLQGDNTPPPANIFIVVFIVIVVHQPSIIIISD